MKLSKASSILGEDAENLVSLYSSIPESIRNIDEGKMPTISNYYLIHRKRFDEFLDMVRDDVLKLNWDMEIEDYDILDNTEENKMFIIMLLEECRINAYILLNKLPMHIKYGASSSSILEILEDNCGVSFCELLSIAEEFNIELDEGLSINIKLDKNEMKPVREVKTRIKTDNLEDIKLLQRVMDKIPTKIKEDNLYDSIKSINAYQNQSPDSFEIVMSAWSDKDRLLLFRKLAGSLSSRCIQYDKPMPNTAILILFTRAPLPLLTINFESVREFLIAFNKMSKSSLEKALKNLAMQDKQCILTKYLYEESDGTELLLNKMCEELRERRHDNLDCSEIADMLYAVAGGKGEIKRISCEQTSFFINIMSQYTKMLDKYLYHEVYVYKGNVYDVMQGAIGHDFSGYYIEILNYNKVKNVTYKDIEAEELESRYNITKDITSVRRIRNNDTER